MPDAPLAFFITFSTFGTHVHGDARGSVNRRRNQPGAPSISPSASLESISQPGSPMILDHAARAVVEHTVAQTCSIRDWQLLAVHARSNHVHVVVGAAVDTPEQMMNAFKSWCTRRLKEAGLPVQPGRVWTRHGSTRWLWKRDSVARAVDYTLNHQDGERFEEEQDP